MAPLLLGRREAATHPEGMQGRQRLDPYAGLRSRVEPFRHDGLRRVIL